MSQNLRFRAVPERAYARQHHLPGNEATPTIAFHDVQNTGMYLDNQPSGEIGFSVKGNRKLLVGNGVRVDGNLIVNGAIIGGDGNAIVPIVDFGNLDHNLIPDLHNTYTIGTDPLRWHTVYASNVDAKDVEISGNLSVLGNTTFTVGFDRVDNDLVPLTSNTYSIGRVAAGWTDAYISNVWSTSIDTHSLSTTTIGTQTMSATDITTTNVDTDTIISQSTRTGTLLTTNGQPFITSYLDATDANIIPSSNITYSLGNVSKQWTSVHTQEIRSGTYLNDDGTPLEFPTDYGNVDQNVIPTSNNTYTLGSQTNQWHSVWTDNVIANSVTTTALLDPTGNTFIPDVDFSNIQSNVSPDANSIYALGSDTKRWTSVWASDLHGNLDAGSLYGNLGGNIGFSGTATFSDGTVAQPSIAFSNEVDTGIYRPQANSIGFTVRGGQQLVITDSAVIASVFGNANTLYYGDASNMTFPADRLQLSQIQITDSNYDQISQTAVEANTIGYVKLFGTSFESGSMAVRYGINLAPSVTVVSYAEIHAQVPAITAGTYDVTVTKNGTQSATLTNGLVVSNIPSWNTDQDLGYVFANIAFDRQLDAEDGNSNIVYEDIPGGSYPLPPNTTIATNGLVSGNITSVDQGNATTYNFDVLATDDQLQSTIRVFTLNYIPKFTTGDKTATSLLQLSRGLIGPSDTQTPQSGLGSVTINGQYICPYDVTLKTGDQNVTVFNESSWFTSTNDSRCQFIKVFGHMNIPAGITFRPNARKPFTVVHITGNLTLDGTISMSQRGARHGVTGSGIASKNVLIASGSYSGVTDPTIAAAGSTGGSAITTTQTQEGQNGGSAGTFTTFLKSGGGGSGGAHTGEPSVTVVSGAGVAGTSYSGGSGGGGVYSIGSSTFTPTAGSAVVDGGAGGSAAINGVSAGTPGSAGGGSGNPGGNGASSITPLPSTLAGASGTGGVLVVIVDGTITGSGSIVARGGDGGTYNSQYGVSGGGGSGGGIAMLIAKSNQSSVTFDVSGGVGGAAYGNPIGGTTPGGKGGNGGAGTSLAITA